MLDDSVLHALNTVARSLGEAREVDEVLHSIVVVACDSLPEIDHAGISITHRDGSIETRAWSDELVTELDQLQYDLNEGPCMDAVDPSVPDDIVRVDDARHEQRWPNFIPAAISHGLRSQLGLRIYTEDKTVGGLNLYSTSTSAISHESELVAELFATHAATALGRVRKESQLTKALETRALIGQATGIVMERYGLDSHRAFDYLTRVSMTGNIKLRDLAAQLVDEAPARSD
ncbi:MAG: GAF and ANTAR domain-containing protein [Marmoricola sp.]